MPPGVAASPRALEAGLNAAAPVRRASGRAPASTATGERRGTEHPLALHHGRAADGDPMMAPSINVRRVSQGPASWVEKHWNISLSAVMPLAVASSVES